MNWNNKKYVVYIIYRNMLNNRCIDPIEKFNYTGNRTARFNPIRVNNSFALERPSYRAGTTKTVPVNVPMPQKIRGGIGNRNITRINFTAPAVRPRDPVDFKKLDAVNLTQFGSKVQLSDKTINDLLRVSVPDPQDFAWIAEKNRLTAMGDPSKPFGRPQRTIQKRINFGQATLGFNEGLSAIRQAVDAGRATSMADRAQLGVQVAAILSNFADLKKMTERQLRDMTLAVSKLKIPRNWKSAGFEHRLWTGNEFPSEKGPIIMYLLSNIPEGLTASQPIASFNEGDGVFRPVSLLKVFQMNSAPKRVLDLEKRQLIPVAMAKSMVVNRGVDNGIFEGLPVAKRAPAQAGPSGADLARFVNVELRAVPAFRGMDWEKQLEGAEYSDVLDLYTDRGLKPPDELRRIIQAAAPLIVQPGEFGVA